MSLGTFLAQPTLLVDDPPSLEITNGSMGINSVRNLLAVHDVAVAMCGGAHLAKLKAYSHKFVSFLTQRTDPETMLRCASITESQAADRPAKVDLKQKGVVNLQHLVEKAKCTG